MSVEGLVGYVVVAVVGGGVGAVELARRYSDDPGRSLLWPGSLLYIMTNVLASMTALALIRTFKWDFGQQGIAREVIQVVLAGVGALTVFRAKLFSAAYRGETFRWSPAGVLEGLLEIADEQVRRQQAKERLRVASKIMPAELSFDKAAIQLPATVLASMGKVASERTEQLAKDVQAIQQNSDFDEATKLQLLGVAIMNFAGPDVLREAINPPTAQ